MASLGVCTSRPLTVPRKCQVSSSLQPSPSRAPGPVARTGSKWAGQRLRNVALRCREESRIRPACVRANAAGPEENFQPRGAITTKMDNSFTDVLNNLFTRAMSLVGLTLDMPTATGNASDLVGDPIFKPLFGWFTQLGGVYKLAFGPKAFVVVSDPVVAKHILRENPGHYSKGILADILEPIMGTGLIPAPFAVWQERRRAIVPGFHKLYLDAMIDVFAQCGLRSINKIDGLLASAGGADVVLDMEAEFSSIALDIIGISIFNYDFGSVTNESPIIKAVYGVLDEATHRSTFYLPYWKIPCISLIVPRQREFAANMKLINDCLDSLINQAMESRVEDDLEALQNRDYAKVKDKSMLRFLVDVRGEESTCRQLRDDLMTMLIAGHETTAAVLTWAMFELCQNHDIMLKARDEVDRVLGDDRMPTMEDARKLPYLRLIVAETLRLYPEPPLLIRRCIQDDVLPGAHMGRPDGYKIPAGTDFFLSCYNIHRNPALWKNPDKFWPERFLEKNVPEKVTESGWQGYDPAPMGQFYPNEINSDYAFLPFGGGQRKCVGDQFAVMESIVILAGMLRKFDFALDIAPKDVGMWMGATLHTNKGLPCRIHPRGSIVGTTSSAAAAATAGAGA
eukprot:jgi/Mesvir1/29210/Mv08628-RA.1